MSELPQLDGQIRVLVIEDDMLAVHSLLARCAEAGMDTRYAPPGAASIEAVRSIHPHLIVLGVTGSEEAGVRLATLLGRESAAPLLVLTDVTPQYPLWQGLLNDTSQFIEKRAAPQDILERITARIRDAYHQKQLMVAESSSDATVKGLPPGWGKCQSCGYIGPRAKFRDINPLARHSLICPVCKHFDDLVFSVA